jgi:hypothetical protein
MNTTRKETKQTMEIVNLLCTLPSIKIYLKLNKLRLLDLNTLSMMMKMTLMYLVAHHLDKVKNMDISNITTTTFHLTLETCQENKQRMLLTHL